VQNKLSQDIYDMRWPLNEFWCRA